MTAHAPISVDDCKRLSRLGLSEPVHEICQRERADGAMAKTHDNAEVVVLDDEGIGEGVLWVEVISRGDDIGYPEGSVLKIKVEGKRATILEYCETWPMLA